MNSLFGIVFGAARLVRRGRKHAFDMFTHGHVPPSTMHPEPELRVPADVHLEHIGATPGSGSANTGTTGAPVLSANAARADVVAAGRLKNET